MQKRNDLRPPRGRGADELFTRAAAEWDRGELRSARRLFRAAAKAGDEGAQHDLAYFYDVGIGVKRNRKAALYWYGRAARSGYSCSASNIGTIFRDEGNFKRALYWFDRAARLGDGDANLQIAKIYLDLKPDLRKAVRYLKSARKAEFITEGSKDEAKRLLKEAEGKLSGGRRGASVVSRPTNVPKTGRVRGRRSRAGPGYD